MNAILRQKLHKARGSTIHGFLPNELLNFSLPARRTKDTTWTRRNGHYTFVVTAGTITDPAGEVVTELPTGKYARAALLYLCTQAKLTSESTLEITKGYRGFMKSLGVEWHGGVRGKEAIRQLMLVSAATFTIIWQDLTYDPEDPQEEQDGEEHYSDRAARFSSSMDLWMQAGRRKVSETRTSTIVLSPMLMEMMDRAVPISMKSWRWLLNNSKSPMALDVYAWLCGRLYRCDGHTRVTWEQLHHQFGSTAPLKRFKQHFRDALTVALMVYSEAQIKEDHGTDRLSGFKGFHLSPSPDPRDSKTPDETG